MVTTTKVTISLILVAIRYQLDLGWERRVTFLALENAMLSTLFITKIIVCGMVQSGDAMFICGWELVFSFGEWCIFYTIKRMTATCFYYFILFMFFSSVERKCHWKCLKQFIVPFQLSLLLTSFFFNLYDNCSRHVIVIYLEVRVWMVERAGRQKRGKRKEGLELSFWKFVHTLIVCPFCVFYFCRNNFSI